MKKVKKVFNVEYDLTSDEFISQKQDEISKKCQNKHGDDFICKVTTFIVKDKKILVHTTEENKNFMGAGNKMLANRLLKNQTFLTMDDDMVKTYEITITANTDLPDYVTALNVAQAKADEMFEKDDSKMPLVTVIDYRWGNAPTTVGASVFSDIDEDGNVISLIGASDSSANVVVGDGGVGREYIELGSPYITATEASEFNIDNRIDITKVVIKTNITVNDSSSMFFAGIPVTENNNEFLFYWCEGAFHNGIRGTSTLSSIYNYDFTEGETYEIEFKYNFLKINGEVIEATGGTWNHGDSYTENILSVGSAKGGTERKGNVTINDFKLYITE